MTAHGSPARTSGPHFFVPPTAVDGDRAELSGDDGRHLALVLRGRPGDPVSIADGTGAIWQGRIAAGVDGTGASPVRVALIARFDVPPPSPRLTVVHGLPKGRKLDDVVQRLTEVGVDRLLPVHTERSPVHLEGPKADKALARWRSVAHAAAKQSRRARLLHIEPVSDWPSTFADASTGAYAGLVGAVLWEEAEERLGEVMDAWGNAPEEIVLGVGPEGGLTPDEVAASGLPAALLGDTILRTETAALVGAGIVLHRVGRLG
jgi:16S rRNA (uracil1498-N3)-methyltransferase